MKCFSAFFISIVPTPGRQGNAFLFWFWILWQFHCSVLMTQHVFCVALHAYLCLWMTAANTWSTASIRLCQVLMLRPRKPVTVWNFFSSFTFRSSPTERQKEANVTLAFSNSKLVWLFSVHLLKPKALYLSVLEALLCAGPRGRCWGAGLCLAEFVPDGGPRCSDECKQNQQSEQTPKCKARHTQRDHSDQQHWVCSSQQPGTRRSLCLWNFGKDNCSFQRMSRKAVCVTGNVLLRAIPLAEHLTLSWAHNTYKVKRILLYWEP